MATAKKDTSTKKTTKTSYTPPKMAKRTLEERDYDEALAAAAKKRNAAKKKTPAKKGK